VVDPLRRHLCFTNADASTPQVAWIAGAVLGVVEAWLDEARQGERERIKAGIEALGTYDELGESVGGEDADLGVDLLIERDAVLALVSREAEASE
jgi:hypothetical protein